ncbi:MAG: glycosyltransferase, partial [Gammaproteobacteria bacterium]
MKPLVSIVIPVFNKADYLTRALDSALGQTYGNVEVVAVDDGSTDASPAILEAAAAANPSLRVHTQENAGLSSARNTGIAGARGDYLMFHDADDVLELDAVENLLEIALAHGSDVVGGVFRRHVNGRSFPVRAFRHNDLRLNFRSMPALAERYCTNFSSCNKLFRTAFLRDAGLEFTPGLYMQDIEFWLKAMFLSDNISQTRHVVSNYHFYPDSSSRSRSAARFESVFTLFERTESFYREHGLEDFLKVRNLAFVQGALMFFVRWKLGEWTRSEDTTDLDRMRALLTLVPAEDFVSYLHRSRGPNAAMLLLVREGDYAEAERIRTSPYTRELAWRRGFGPLDTPEQVMALARRIGRSRLRNAAYSVYYASEYFLHNPRQLVNAGRNAARKGAGRVTRMLVPAATVLRPLVSALRDVTRIVLQPHESEVPRYRTVRRLRRLSFLLLGPLGPRLAEAEKRSAARHALERARARSAGITGKHFLVFGLGDLYRIGGVQLSYRRLFEHLCAQGHIVTFYSHRDRPEGSKPYYPFPDQVEIAHYRLADTPASWQGIASIAEHHDPDCILIVNSGQPSLILAAALYDLPYPVVY